MKAEDLVGSDTLNYTVSRAVGEKAGTYDITPSGEEKQGNYTVTYKPATFSIKAGEIIHRLIISSFISLKEGSVAQDE